MMMTHHPLLLALRPMGAMQQLCQPLLLRSVDGSDAHLASATALGSPANGGDFSEGGDATDAGSVGKEAGPDGDGATAAPSIPPVQQSTLFPIFRQGNA